MRARLTQNAHALRSAAPAVLVVATLLTAATGASAVTLRKSSPAAHHKTTMAAASTGASLSALPPPPKPSAPPESSNFAAPLAGSSVAKVPRPKHLVEATLLVTGHRSLSAAQLRRLGHLSGVRAVQTVDAGRAVVDGHDAFVLGVDPTRFRPWTPRLTARSQPLWQSIASGELTASFDMGHDAQLPLGATIAVRSRREAPVRIGAFASVGMAGVDAVIDHTRAVDVGLAQRTGVVISAPHADVLALRRAAMAIVGPHARGWLLRQVVVIRDAGEFMTRSQITTVLEAARSRIGVPYVWGATGPSAFDCSGLVQWSFARAGIAMPRVSEQQFYAGPHIPYADARPGDLLFWHYDPTDPTNVDHVAIYWGNGMMVVAPHTGQYVEYVPVPLNNLAGVVRVDPGMAAQIA